MEFWIGNIETIFLLNVAYADYLFCLHFRKISFKSVDTEWSNV